MRNLIERIETDTGHYYRNMKTGTQIPGVTTVAGVMPKEKLDNWKLRKAVSLALKGESAWKKMPEGADPVSWLVGAGTREANVAAEAGTNVHDFAEKHMLGLDPDINELTKKERFHAECYLQFVRDHQPKPVLVEKVLTYIDPKSGMPLYCGTMDLIAELTDEAVWLVDYKAPVALDTPIPTPTGWTTMGQLKVGDTVFDIDGNPVTVTDKSATKMNPCVRVIFDDKSSVICDEDHPWVVVDSYPPSRMDKRRTVKAKDLSSEMWNGKQIPQRRLHVEIAQPIQLPQAQVPLDPYVLGVWLGDGASTKGEITVGTLGLGIVEECKSRGWDPSWSTDRRPGTAQFGYKGLQTILKSVRVYGDKHIPDLYLRASVDQRIDLLRGLMDTDGSWNRIRKTAVFVNTNKTLALQVRELVLSLGQRASFIPYRASGFNVTTEAYLVEWKPIHFNPFLSIPHKREQVIIGKGKQNWRRTILSAEPTLTVPTQCITTDSPTSTFLCGKEMIPTHNSSSQPRASHAIQSAAYTYATHWLGEDGTLHPMPKIDKAAVVLLNGGGRPDKCYRMIRLDNGPVVFSVFKSLLKVYNFSKVEERTILGEVGAD